MDHIDCQILDLLRSNARIPISELARAVGLSPAPMSRRIQSLESSGIIEGCVAVIREDKEFVDAVHCQVGTAREVLAK